MEETPCAKALGQEDKVDDSDLKKTCEARAEKSRDNSHIR